jgi:ribosomal protein S18 acetylase RimI-like enzyme
MALDFYYTLCGLRTNWYAKMPVANNAAIRLYQRLGFKTDRVKRIGAEDYWHMIRGL